MTKVLGLVILFAACGVEQPKSAKVDQVDQVESADTVDHETAESCCSLWPDANAIQECVALPHGACGTLRCDTSDGPVQVGVCGL